ncbi:MAG: hypothetical protein EBS01_11525 [Verrucomicrobia bacterium]|nr:hypothetical protein [Verrucomicrobiota bacterium]
MPPVCRQFVASLSLGVLRATGAERRAPRSLLRRKSGISFKKSELAKILVRLRPCIPSKLCKTLAMPDSRPSETPSSSLLAVTQTAVGCGIGLLLAGKLQRPAQKTTAATLLSLGVLLAIPAVVHTVLRAWQGPESDRGMRRRLDSIRQDPGLMDETDAY